MTFPAGNPCTAVVESLPNVEVCDLGDCPDGQTPDCTGVSVKKLMFGTGLSVSTEGDDECERTATVHGGLVVDSFGTITGIELGPCLEMIEGDADCEGVLKIANEITPQTVTVVTSIDCDDEGKILGYCTKDLSFNSCGLLTDVSPQQDCYDCYDTTASFLPMTFSDEQVS